MSGIPILLEAASLHVLVVGGGDVAARRAGTLARGGARVRVVSPRIADAMRLLAASHALDVLERAYESGDIGEADVVIAATDDPAVNRAVAADARKAHRLINVADVPVEGNFAMMARHRSGPLVVGVSAGGLPGAASRIRDAIADRFDDRYGRALEDLVALRRTLLERGDRTRWRELSSDVLGAAFCASVEGESLGEQVSPWR